MMGFNGASLFPSSDTGTGESLGFSLLSVLLGLFLLGRRGAGARYGMRRDAPSLPAYKTEAPLTFFCGARSAVLSSTDTSISTCRRIQRNTCTRILAWLSRCPNLNNAIGLPWVSSASLFHLRMDHAMPTTSWCLAFVICICMYVYLLVGPELSSCVHENESLIRTTWYRAIKMFRCLSSIGLVIRSNTFSQERHYRKWINSVFKRFRWHYWINLSSSFSTDEHIVYKVKRNWMFRYD